MGRKVATMVTYLEMAARPAVRRHHAPPQPDHLPVAFQRAHRPPVHFYRYLYETVGRAYRWVDRTRMSDAELAAAIHDPKVEIYVLSVGGVPSGYAELDFRQPDLCNLAYMGLTPEAVGRGLGAFLLGCAVDVAWDRGIAKLTVNTCTLDHPRALPLYQKMGFVPVAQRESEIELLD